VTVRIESCRLLIHGSEPEQAVGDTEAEDDNKLVSGNLMAFVERLDDEFTKSLQSIDPHTQEYVQR
jgi:translation initiation factor 3 subunit C